MAGRAAARTAGLIVLASFLTVSIRLTWMGLVPTVVFPALASLLPRLLSLRSTADLLARSSFFGALLWILLAALRTRTMTRILIPLLCHIHLLMTEPWKTNGSTVAAVADATVMPRFADPVAAA